jgi:ubiquinone/menaquinone biosynthesis C-methylase UbiE
VDKRELRRKYDDAAGWYDAVEVIPELLGVRRLRRELLKDATGVTLEVACGTGLNFSSYPRGVKLVATDFSEEMLKAAGGRAWASDLDIDFLVMDGERLAFAERVFDTVVSSLTLCTFTHPVGALREMARVCRPSGQILLLEHGLSDRGWIRRWQNYRAESHERRLGCQWNREPLKLLAQAGLSPVSVRRTLFGIFHLIQARPLKAAEVPARLGRLARCPTPA